MADGDNEGSGELSSFLHLTGFRPLILMLIAGAAGVVGLYFALGAPAQWVARYSVNVGRVADDDLTPAELDIFVEEVANNMTLPVVINEVERLTGLIDEVDYELNSNQVSISLIDVNVSADTAEEAQLLAVDTTIVALRISLEDTRTELQATRDQLREAIGELDSRSAELVREAGGVNPTNASTRAANLYLARLEFLRNRPTIQVTDDDGITTIVPAPEPEPSIEDLLAEVTRLEPIDREYRQAQAEINELNIRLTERLSSIREATGSINLLDNERTDPFVIREVVTEEASRISGLLTGLLLFAVPAALLTIFVFVLFDALRPSQETFLAPGDPFAPYGVLDHSLQQELPDSTTRLVVVDEKPSGKAPVSDFDVLADHISEADEPDEPAPPKSKASRWGRDASSKAV